MKFKLFFTLISIFFVQIVNAQWNQVGPIWEGGIASGSFGFEIDLNDDGTVMAVGDPFRFVSNQPNPVRIYERQQDDSWLETGLIFNDQGVTPCDGFGEALEFSADGTILAIGIPDTGPNGILGRVEVYENIDGTWTQIGNDITNTISGPAFGEAVALSADGSTIAIASPFDLNQNRIGFVQIFRNVDGIWEQIGQTLGQATDDRSFGSSLSISDDGNVLLVGIEDPFSAPGRLEVYRNVNDTWEQIGQDLVGLGTDSQFGSNTAISADGNFIVGAALTPNGSFTAYIQVFENQNDNWVQRGSTLMNDPQSQVNEFGSGLAITDDGSLLFAGDSRANSRDGSVEIFAFENGDWQSQQIIAGPTNEDAEFGRALAIDGDGEVLMVGSPSYLGNSNEFVGALQFFFNEGALSTEDVNRLQENIRLYPNPVVNTLNVEINDVLIASVTITDVFGRSIRQYDLTNTNTQFDFSNLSSGVYLLTFQDQLGRSHTNRIVKE